MTTTLGIDNLLLAAKAVGELGTFGGDVFSDGGFTPGDIVYIPELLKALKDVSAVDYLDLLPEVSDLDDVERANLVVAFKVNFKLKDYATIEAMLEEGFEILSYGLTAVQSLKDLWEKFFKSTPVAG